MVQIWNAVSPIVPELRLSLVRTRRFQTLARMGKGEVCNGRLLPSNRPILHDTFIRILVDEN